MKKDSTKKGDYPRVSIRGVSLKKKFGQHFLRDNLVIQEMLDMVVLDETTSVFEIGCGDGFLTYAILERPIKRLWVFEIDADWATYVQENFGDPRMSIFQEDILSVNFERFKPDSPWILLANLPYKITFPLLYLLERNASLLREGVIMVQEEVAQKIAAKRGRPYGFSSLFFQHAFEWKLLTKIPPEAFFPPPKVFSRLLYLKPKVYRDVIPDEEHFWDFVKKCFAQPRRMLKHNLISGGYNVSTIPNEVLSSRAQQLSKKELIDIWELVRNVHSEQ